MMLLSYWKKFKYLFGNTIYHSLHPTVQDAITVNGWILSKRGKVCKRNFGDELNVYMLEELTGCPVSVYKSWFHLSKENYMVIGSLIDRFTDKQSVIWGSGILSDKVPLSYKPKKVCAVRGKITRNYLLRNGIECPEIYGDPALLLPYLYRPDVSKQYKMGIIPHIHDLDNPLVVNFVERNKSSVCLIDFAHYEDWHDVIDLICSCECIVSSSLHGLILSDAYRIPNLWIRISDRVNGGDCKFMDYFSGVGRTTTSAFVMNGDTVLPELVGQMKYYKEIVYTPQELVAACPFKLKLEFRKP